jgi:hypothetical protein
MVRWDARTPVTVRSHLPGRERLSCRCADVLRGTAGGASGLLGPGPDASVDEFHPFPDGSGGYVDQLKAVVAVGLLVETLERDRFARG